MSEEVNLAAVGYVVFIHSMYCKMYLFVQWEINAAVESVCMTPGLALLLKQGDVLKLHVTTKCLCRRKGGL